MSQTQPLCIGLTGGIGSGKSTVAQLFEKHDVPVIDADQVARQVVEPESEGLTALIEAFGPSILQADGSLDRALLRQRIFAAPEERAAVEAILHPRIHAEIERQVSKTEAPYLILMIPLLIEGKSTYPIARILVVDLPETIQIQRVMRRDQTTQEEAQAILNAQVIREERLQAADDIITNINQDQLADQVEQLHHTYLALAEQEIAFQI